MLNEPSLIEFVASITLVIGLTIRLANLIPINVDTNIKINIARKNLFYDWLASKNKLGGQNKIPRLSNSREYIDELIKMN